MIKNTIKNGLIYSIIGVIIIFLLWFLLYFIVKNTYLIPSPILVIKQSFLNLIKLEFYSHLLNTLLRVLLSLFVSFAFSITLAIVSHLYKGFEGVMLPIISVLRSLPVLAVLLIILVFIPRVIAPVIVCVLSVLPIIYSQTLNYLNGVDSKQKQMLKFYKVPLKTQIFKVYLKGYLPLLVIETSILFSFSLKLVVSAEILANVYKSIGGDVSNASIYSNVTEMFSVTLIICLIGLIVELIGKQIHSKMEKQYK